MFEDEILLKLVSAIIIGGLIGFEREYRDKAAGFRTMILITTGSMLFTYLSLYIGGESDPVRMTAAIITGIGFLGAGAILVDKGKIQGLTTASTIWLTAALGIAVGAGAYGVAYLSTFAVLIVLWFLPYFEHYLDRRYTHVTYTVTVRASYDIDELLDKLHTNHNLAVESIYRTRKKDILTIEWRARGNINDHDDMIDQFMKHPEVLEVSTS
jgi:putative Mg2+ transporter-C (MgtC) family protein